jgi:hypothetical protein
MRERGFDWVNGETFLTERAHECSDVHPRISLRSSCRPFPE